MPQKKSDAPSWLPTQPPWSESNFSWNIDYQASSTAPLELGVTNNSSSLVRTASTRPGVSGSNPAQGFISGIFLNIDIGMSEFTRLIIISLFEICLSIYWILTLTKTCQIYIVYVIESAAYEVLFTSCLCQKPERARYERVRAFGTNNE